MKSSRFRLSVVALALLCVVTCLAPVAMASTPKPPPPVDGRKLIKSVDGKNSSVTIVYMRDKSTHIYKVDFMTDLKINNQAGKFGDIKAGMVVDDYLERDNDDLDGLSLSGYGTTPVVPKAAAKPKPPAKPKPTTTPATP